MPIIKRESGEIAILELKGKVDNELSNELKSEFLNLIKQNKYNIIVNMAEVNFIHSFGIAVLVAGVKKIRANDGEVGFCNLQTYIKELFEMVRLTNVLSIFDTEEEALESFGEK